MLSFLAQKPTYPLDVMNEGGETRDIVMNELQKLMMSVDFLANTSHTICPGV